MDMSRTTLTEGPTPLADAVSGFDGFGSHGQPDPSPSRRTNPGRHEALAFGLATLACLLAVGLMVGAGFLMLGLQKRLTPNPHAPLPLAALPPGPMLDSEAFAHGRDLFVATCAACHGPKGLGVTGLGKDLTRSLFVYEQNDAQLVSFIRRGRPAEDPLNTTKVPMPPLGGNPALTALDLEHIASFLRGLQDPRRAPDVPEPVVVVQAPSEDETNAALEAAGGDPELAEWIAHGNKIFMASCAACHGKDARGMTGLGRDLIASEFVQSLDDDALLAFLLKGRDPSDPLNTTKVAMPPKGGNPALSEDDLLDVIAYLRSLSATKATAAPST